MIYCWWDSLFTSANSTSNINAFLQLVHLHFLQKFPTRIRDVVDCAALMGHVHAGLITAGQKRLMFRFIIIHDQSVTALFHETSQVFYTGKRESRWESRLLKSNVFFFSFPHLPTSLPSTLTLLVKYDTTKTELKARPVMCLLHCMLTWRLSAAGTWFPTKKQLYISSTETVSNWTHFKIGNFPHGPRWHVKTSLDKDRLCVEGYFPAPKHRLQNVSHCRLMKAFDS